MAIAVTILQILPFKTNTHRMLNRKSNHGVARKCDLFLFGARGLQLGVQDWSQVLEEIGGRTGGIEEVREPPSW